MLSLGFRWRVTLAEMERRSAMSRSEALAYAERAAARLARDPRGLLVYVFGSAAATGRPHARDVDLAVLTTSALSLDELMRLRADVVEATRAPVDLVSLNEASIVLAHEVADSGRCLYARAPDVEVDFVTRARARYWDFKPYRDAQWRLAGERLAERQRGS
jgi:predicted nucleotidyltransferase